MRQKRSLTTEEMIYDDVKEIKKRVNSIDRRLAAVEVRAGFIGAVAGGLMFLATKVGAVVAWLSGGK